MLHFPDLLRRSIFGVRWSPDGRQLAFDLFSWDYSRDKVCILNLDDGALDCVEEARYVSWLSNQREISYLSGSKHAEAIHYDFCLLGLEHQPWQPTCFPVEFSGIGRGYDWSPDGKWIAYNREGDGVYVRSAATDESRRLVEDKEVVGGLVSWSPDGRMIAYRTYPTQPKARWYILWVVDVQSGQTLVRVEDVIGAYWSFGNKALAVTGGQDHSIYLVFVPGGEVWKVPGTEGAGLIAW